MAMPESSEKASNIIMKDILHIMAMSESSEKASGSIMQDILQDADRGSEEST